MKKNLIISAILVLGIMGTAGCTHMDKSEECTVDANGNKKCGTGGGNTIPTEGTGN